jgi:hypothetical protein
MKKKEFISFTTERTLTFKGQFAVYNHHLGNEKISTIGGILIDKNKFKYGLGTCHGLKRQFVENQTAFLDDRDDEIKFKKDDTVFGKIKAILFTDELDISLIRIDGRRKMEAGVIDNSAIGSPTQIYTPLAKDEKNLKVVLFSDLQDEQEVQGIVIQSNTPAIIDFSINGKVQKTMNNLIAISTDLVNGKALTVDGDSGVWVRTKEKNEVIGMVIGASNDFTYVMKMENILKACESDLKINLSILINENDEKRPN